MKIEIFQIQDGRRTPYWISFLAISRRHIGRLLQISEWRWRITCRYRSLDQNGNFRKFKMADGRHFENSFISISQSELGVYPISITFGMPMQIYIPWMAIWQKKSKFFKFKMADGRHIENRFFWLYLGALLTDRREIPCRFVLCVFICAFWFVCMSPFFCFPEQLSHFPYSFWR